MNFTEEQINIEKKECQVLQNVCCIINLSLDEFNTKYSESLKYINYITLPIIMASIEDKSYNPFSEIIEKHISFIVNKKMEILGYTMLPLGYSSDLTFESDNYIINLDIKTANIDNPADFKNEIALGFNQTSYSAVLPAGVRKVTEYHSNGIKQVKTFPNTPAIYSTTETKKANLTFGLLFIYPKYKEIIDKIRNDYKDIRQLFNKKLYSLYKQVFKNQNDIDKFLNYKPQKVKFKRCEIIVENLIRSYFIHKKQSINLTKKDIQTLQLFEQKIIHISNLLAKTEIKPIAIISISIPNGKLSPHYDDEIVSGKDFGKSIRYHYKEGIFKGLKNSKSRVIFIYYNEVYLQKLKKYFDKIVKYEFKEVENNINDGI